MLQLSKLDGCGKSGNLVYIYFASCDKRLAQVAIGVKVTILLNCIRLSSHSPILHRCTHTRAHIYLRGGGVLMP